MTPYQASYQPVNALLEYHLYSIIIDYLENDRLQLPTTLHGWAIFSLWCQCLYSRTWKDGGLFSRSFHDTLGFIYDQ